MDKHDIKVNFSQQNQTNKKELSKIRRTLLVLAKRYDYPRQRSKYLSNSKVSHMSNKWHPQAQLQIKWTKQHIDEYLPIADELAMEQAKC
jgi:hypothetical protein